jgi:predicted lysophospholipase L1 biosynthesis ABC-type transport system permease subunit
MRAREFAIRASMGASPARLRRGVVMGTWRLVATAGVLATVAGGAAGHVMRAYLYGIGPLDPLIVLAVLAVLFCCGAGAALVAARHAAVASPAEMLRGT